MRIAISSTGPDLEARVDRRFGRRKVFVLVDSDSMEFECETAASVSAGTGVPAALFVVNPADGISGTSPPEAESRPPIVAW